MYFSAVTYAYNGHLFYTIRGGHVEEMFARVENGLPIVAKNCSIIFKSQHLSQPSCETLYGLVHCGS